MNWINAFEITCYFITLLLLKNIIQKRDKDEFFLFLSACLTGFILELLAVRLTGIYHYSSDYYISIGIKPYQFPFFGGLMWGGLTVCALRLAKKFNFNTIMSSLFAGWMIVSMDILLDVVAIRLDGGFWIWEGRPITYAINHHMFMSVIWVNFLGYMFEVPSMVFLTLKYARKEEKSSIWSLMVSVCISLATVAIVGIASGASLFLDSITDEWFSCIAFILLWIIVLIKSMSLILKQRERLLLTGKKDWTLLIFWMSIYAYCISALFHLGIMEAVPIYGVFAAMLAVMTLGLILVNIEK